MALLEILRFPDPRLRVKAQPITKIDDHLLKLAEDMRETMYAHNGVGLAATQIGVHQQIFVMDVSETRDQLFYILNPEIISRSGTQNDIEGCLSVSGNAFDRVGRAMHVIMSGMDLSGKSIELDAQKLMAACIQHEIDHLKGILFIDHLSRLKQERIKKKIEKSSRRD